MAITQECCEQYWISPGGNTPQSANYTATWLPSRKVRRTRHAEHCWRSRDELISDVLLGIPTYGRAKAGWPARIYIQQLYEDTGCSPEDLPEAMNDSEKWRERVSDIRASGTTWWWWWWWLSYTWKHFLGKSDGAVEYTDCRGLRPLLQWMSKIWH